MEIFLFYIESCDFLTSFSYGGTWLTEKEATINKAKKNKIIQMGDCGFTLTYPTGWQQWTRKILVVLSCLQREQPLQHQHCAATHFSPKIQARIKLKTETKEQTSPNGKLGGVGTWMLLWAKKRQNAEWKLTSTFFHPNCCNPRIISSVYKPKLYHHLLPCHTVRISLKNYHIISFCGKLILPSMISWYSTVFSVLGVFCAASFALAASGRKWGPSEATGGQYSTSTTCL